MIGVMGHYKDNTRTLDIRAFNSYFSCIFCNNAWKRQNKLNLYNGKQGIILFLCIMQ